MASWSPSRPPDKTSGSHPLPCSRSFELPLANAIRPAFLMTTLRGSIPHFHSQPVALQFSLTSIGCADWELNVKVPVSSRP